jgi:hypothetical protein
MYSSFKAICDSYGLNLSEFEQIFSANEAAFSIWDSDNNGIIDGLEIFTGLAFFAEARIEDKLGCIY